MAKAMAKSGKFDAVITVGAVVGQLSYQPRCRLTLASKELPPCKDILSVDAAQPGQLCHGTDDLTSLRR